MRSRRAGTSLAAALLAASLIVGTPALAQAAPGLATAPVPAQLLPAAFTPAPDPLPPTLITKPDLHPVSLSSKPGALKTIWLVFQGGELSGTNWNSGRHLQDAAQTPVPYAAPIDFNPAGNDSVAMRTEVFNRMAELFSPFDVNVTTVRPAATALSKDSLVDPSYGGVVLYTNDMFSSGLHFHDADDADGLAHTPSFGDPSDYFAWVSTTLMSGNPKELADVAAHEVGHTLGLHHQGVGSQAYYSPSGLWAPIMGSGTDAAMVRWSNAQYPNSLGGQDDLAVMTDASAVTQTEKYYLPDGTPASSNTGFCQAGGGVAWIAVVGVACDDIPEASRQYVGYHDYFTGRLDYAADDHGNTPAT
ncbi:zinc-dependent metalloprotease, partial [Psychromicrobium xiongbiense]|uniref:zinc-dependent metalloprotease n=1 Tax=Psychromicrobium xiongbiense TaxID=3051184 RepID=UPI002553C0EC